MSSAGKTIADDGNTSKPLAIMTPVIGFYSETFIRRHVNELLPGKTVVLARAKASPHEWDCEGPVIYADRNKDPKYRMALERLGVLSTPSVANVRSFFRKSGVEVVLGEFLFYPYHWFRFLGKDFPFYVHGHGIDASKYLRSDLWRERYQIYKRARGIITPSRFMADALVAAGLPHSMVEVIPYGVDVSDSPRKSNPTEVTRLLAVGRMVEKKAPLLTVKACEYALQSGADIELEMIGDGPLFQTVSDYVTQRGLLDRIRLHGAKPHSFVKEMLSCCDVFVQHSVVDPESGDTEGLPVGILEALANSLPVISTRHAGIPEAVTDRECGFLVEEGDWQAMGSSIKKIADDHELRGEMAINGWRRAKENYSWSVERARILDFIGLRP